MFALPKSYADIMSSSSKDAKSEDATSEDATTNDNYGINGGSIVDHAESSPAKASVVGDVLFYVFLCSLVLLFVIGACYVEYNKPFFSTPAPTEGYPHPAYIPSSVFHAMVAALFLAYLTLQLFKRTRQKPTNALTIMGIVGVVLMIGIYGFNVVAMQFSWSLFVLAKSHWRWEYSLGFLDVLRNGNFRQQLFTRPKSGSWWVDEPGKWGQFGCVLLQCWKCTPILILLFSYIMLAIVMVDAPMGSETTYHKLPATFVVMVFIMGLYFYVTFNYYNNIETPMSEGASSTFQTFSRVFSLDVFALIVGLIILIYMIYMIYMLIKYYSSSKKEGFANPNDDPADDEQASSSSPPLLKKLSRYTTRTTRRLNQWLGGFGIAIDGHEDDTDDEDVDTDDENDYGDEDVVDWVQTYDIRTFYMRVNVGESRFNREFTRLKVFVRKFLSALASDQNHHNRGRLIIELYDKRCTFEHKDPARIVRDLRAKWIRLHDWLSHPVRRRKIASEYYFVCRSRTDPTNSKTFVAHRNMHRKTLPAKGIDLVRRYKDLADLDQHQPHRRNVVRFKATRTGTTCTKFVQRYGKNGRDNREHRSYLFLVPKQFVRNHECCANGF